MFLDVLLRSTPFPPSMTESINWWLLSSILVSTLRIEVIHTAIYLIKWRISTYKSRYFTNRFQQLEISNPTPNSFNYGHIGNLEVHLEVVLIIGYTTETLLISFYTNSEK